VIRLRFDFDLATTKSEHVHFFVASRGVVSNKKAAVGAYNEVIVYVTVIRMAFTLTDQHRVASFDCRPWYSPFSYFLSKMSSGYCGMNSCLHQHTVMMPTFSDESNRSWIVTLITIIVVESQSNWSRIAIVIATLAKKQKDAKLTARSEPTKDIARMSGWSQTNVTATDQTHYVVHLTILNVNSGLMSTLLCSWDIKIQQW